WSASHSKTCFQGLLLNSNLTRFSAAGAAGAACGLWGAAGTRVSPGKSKPATTIAAATDRPTTERVERVSGCIRAIPCQATRKTGEPGRKFILQPPRQAQ